MHHSLFPVHIAGLLGLGPQELILIALIFTFPVVILVVIASALYFKHSREKMWYETARLALEKGQPLPTPPGGNFPGRLHAGAEPNDIRTGLTLIAVGVGLAVFFSTVGAPQAIGLGAIPGFIGVALLLFGVFSRKKSPPEARPPQT